MVQLPVSFRIKWRIREIYCSFYDIYVRRTPCIYLWYSKANNWFFVTWRREKKMRCLSRTRPCRWTIRLIVSFLQIFQRIPKFHSQSFPHITLGKLFFSFIKFYHFSFSIYFFSSKRTHIKKYSIMKMVFM